jgi:uncharacterized protein
MHENRESYTDQIFSIPLAEAGDDKYLIYAPFKGIAFIANPALVNLMVDTFASGIDDSQIASSDPGLMNFLYSLDFFTPAPLPEDATDDTGGAVDTAVLFLTNRCNLKCSYCYADANPSLPCDMTADLAKAAIDFVHKGVIRHGGKRMTLAFHGGGEPFMNMPVMQAAVDHARCLSDRGDIELTVAGSSNAAWSEATCRFVLDHFTEMSLSVDGLPETQNRQRPDISGGPSFPRVLKNINRLDQAGFSYGIRMTVTDTSVGQMAENVRFLCEHTGARKIQVEPVFFEGRAVRRHLPEVVPERFIEQFKSAYGIARGHGVHLFYSGARPEVLASRFCLSTGSAFVVTAEGDVTTCFEIHNRNHPLSDALIIGSYDGGRFVFTRDRHGIDRNQHVHRISRCQGCFCKWHCAGDCLIRRENDGSKGHDTEAQPVRCILTREITRYLLCRKIIDAGGVICSDTWKV